MRFKILHHATLFLTGTKIGLLYLLPSTSRELQGNKNPQNFTKNSSLCRPAHEVYETNSMKETLKVNAIKVLVLFELDF